MGMGTENVKLYIGKCKSKEYVWAPESSAVFQFQKVIFATNPFYPLIVHCVAEGLSPSAINSEML